MKKLDKEKSLIEVKLKEIESYDRDSTSLFFKILIGVVGIAAFLYNDGILTFEKLFWGLLTMLFFISWIQWQINKYIEDRYNCLQDSIKKDEILIHKMPKLPWWAFLYYWKKYK